MDKHFTDALEDSLLAVGYMRGVEDDYNGEMMDFFLGQIKCPGQLISGLSNIVLTLLDDRAKETNRTPKQVLDSLSVRYNSAV